MKDIEKMKREFEQKLKLAELENKLEVEIGCTFSVFDGYGRTYAHAKNIELSQAARLLATYAPTENVELDSTATARATKSYVYRVEAERRYSDHFTSLVISWVSNNIHFQFTMPIDGNERLAQFFTDGQREMTRTEQSTYKPTRGNKLVYNLTLPIKRFKCEYIEYQGGHLSLLNTNEIDKIIRTIKRNG